MKAKVRRGFVGLASGARLYRSADGRLHAGVKVGDRYEIYGLNSSGFRDSLIDEYFVDRREPPSRWAVRRVVNAFKARARFDGTYRRLHSRRPRP